jgi:hypothetical protein
MQQHGALIHRLAARSDVLQARACGEHGAGRLISQAAARPKSAYEHQEASEAKRRKEE